MDHILELQISSYVEILPFGHHTKCYCLVQIVHANVEMLLSVAESFPSTLHTCFLPNWHAWDPNKFYFIRLKLFDLFPPKGLRSGKASQESATA